MAWESDRVMTLSFSTCTVHLTVFTSQIEALECLGMAMAEAWHKQCHDGDAVCIDFCQEQILWWMSPYPSHLCARILQCAGDGPGTTQRIPFLCHLFRCCGAYPQGIQHFFLLPSLFSLLRHARAVQRRLLVVGVEGLHVGEVRLGR